MSGARRGPVPLSPATLLRSWGGQGPSEPPSSTELAGDAELGCRRGGAHPHRPAGAPQGRMSGARRGPVPLSPATLLRSWGGQGPSEPPRSTELAGDAGSTRARAARARGRASRVHRKKR